MGPDPGFGVYIHWPFCAAKCPYCDFNSHVAASAVDHDMWQRAMVAEIERAAGSCDRQLVTSVFFGGGTPSLMPPGLVEGCLNAVAGSLPVANDCEVTLEANPTSVDAKRFAGYRAAGVSRLSLGVQALNDADLKRLGRLHSVAEALDAYDLARRTFEQVSFDLIYARQDQTLAEWEGELRQALDLAADHLSLYQLTIEPRTRFGDLHALGKLRGLPGNEVAADLYELTAAACEAAGFEFYEVSNAAKSGGMCRHNLTYWRYGPYIGVGPGAHGRVVRDGDRFAEESWAAPGKWVAAAMAGDGVSTRRRLDAGEAAGEYVMMALRLTEGLSPDRVEALGGGIDAGAIEDLAADGFLSVEGRQVAATAKGRLVLNALIEKLL